MVETYRRKVQTKDPPLATYVQAVKSVGDWIIEGYKAKIVPPSAGADGLVIRDYGDTTDRIKLIEDGKIQAINLEAIGGQTKIVPPSAGADALVVRDYTDTEDRIRVTEDKKIMFPTEGVLLKGEAETVQIRNLADTAYKGFVTQFVDLFGPISFKTNDVIRTGATATSYFILRSHNGTAYVDCAKLIGGYLEIAKGKLTGRLDAGGQDIISVADLSGRVGNFDFRILARRSAAYAGDAFFLTTRNSLDAEINRLIITGGVDIAEIKIANSKLNLQSNKLLNPKTFTVRPALADMEVGEIAFGIGTGPAGEDEIFFKPDATRISYWTASGTITA